VDIAGLSRIRQGPELAGSGSPISNHSTATALTTVSKHGRQHTVLAGGRANARRRRYSGRWITPLAVPATWRRPWNIVCQ